MKRSISLIVFSLVIAGFLLSSCAEAPAAPAKVAPAILETVEGSDRNRVKLTEKAATRLGIETDVVREEMVVRKRKVGGTVVDAATLIDVGLTVAVTGTRRSFVSVLLSETDRRLLDKSQSVVIKSLSASKADSDDDGMLSKPLEVKNPSDDVNVPVYFMVNDSDSGLAPGESVFVEFSLTGKGTPQKIVPYSAVLYDVKGETWVYTSPSPLVFTRQSIVVDYIDGDNTVLLDGPPAGTLVVTVGAPELYGIDTGVDK